MEVHNEVVPLKDALAINGLRAVFGEVYPDPVRVVSVGPKVDHTSHFRPHPHPHRLMSWSQAAHSLVIGVDWLCLWCVQVQDLLGVPGNTDWVDSSIEFCGGTHISNTREAEAFVITGDELLGSR